MSKFSVRARLRSFVYAFAEMLSDRLARPLIDQALSGQQPASPDYQL